VDFYTFDDEYVRRLREGDPWTVNHFFHYFSDLMYAKLCQRLRSKDAIDDVRQEVFKRVFEKLRSADGGLRDSSKLGPFVNSYCNNVLLEYYRNNGRTNGGDDDHDDVVDPKDPVDVVLVNRETEDAVRRVLAALERKDRDILRAVFFEERDKDQICRDFRVTRDYLRVLLYRAKAKFREEYSSSGGKVLPMRDKRPRKEPPVSPPVDPEPKPDDRNDRNEDV
jgi:RNA polymerase sigma-70 factor (ECF subfamily)